ncbi:MAG: DUF975 family protein [Erysipelotrichaceae bacterium]
MYKHFKTQSINIIREHFLQIILGTLLMLVLTGSFISATISYDIMGNLDGFMISVWIFDIYTFEGSTFQQLIQIASTFSIISLAASLFVVIPISYGYEKYIYNLITQGSDSDYKTIFSAYKDGFGKIVVVNLLVSTIVIFGTICFIIPGIIYSMMYMYVNLVMIQYPELGVWATIKKSASIMSGYKMVLFWFGLSFILWHLLSAYTFGIGSLFVIPYIQIAFVLIFIDITKHIKEDEAFIDDRSYSDFD